MRKTKTEHGFFTDNEESGETAEEVYEKWLLQDLHPPLQEIQDAEMEIKTINLLTDMGVI
ncbi:hypothetical protein [Lysinibacillus sp. NPDC047702]|uniref:hypothetical protein n=1 Tax=unclassified Lysinibacillus TaxID=2636778 RepID=UPI003CFE1957